MPERRRLLAFGTLAAAALLSGQAPADPAQQLASLCGGAIARAVDAVPGNGALFLQSYPDAEQGLRPAALGQAAFTYDNALAVHALLAVGETARARRVAEALLLAAGHDRFWRDGRLRNAYRAGPVGEAPPALPGWWDAAAGRWDEDRYQAGTATGNVAWAALALLATAQATGEARFRDGAASLMRWVAEHTLDATAPAGFVGGFFGHEPAPERQGWKSTEHNLDSCAAFAWLARHDAAPRWQEHAALARAFVAAMWDAPERRFLLGTGPDGRTLNRAGSGLDAQLWPLLALPDAPLDWRGALDSVRAHYAAEGGFGFRSAPDGLWTEGTAQAAATFGRCGDAEGAVKLFPVLLAQAAPGGFLRAAARERVSTGLAIGPDSTTPDFFYFRLPHLGATAWAVLAARSWNPFRPP